MERERDTAERSNYSNTLLICFHEVDSLTAISKVPCGHDDVIVSLDMHTVTLRSLM